MDLKKQLQKASKLIDNWQIDEADKVLNELYTRYPGNNDIRILLAVTQNSLRNQNNALILLDSILDSDPEHEHAIAMYPSVVIELADKFIANKNFTPLKEKLEKIVRIGFEKIGFDLGTVYEYLSAIHEKNGDIRKAIDYLELQKELYKKDEFLKDYHISSGEIDKKIEMLMQKNNL